MKELKLMQRQMDGCWDRGNQQASSENPVQESNYTTSSSVSVLLTDNSGQQWAENNRRPESAQHVNQSANIQQSHNRSDSRKHRRSRSQGHDDDRGQGQSTSQSTRWRSSFSESDEGNRS